MRYIEQSTAIIGTIDASDIGGLAIGEAIGHGSTFSTYVLGELPGHVEALHAGLKLSDNSYDIAGQIIADVALIDMLVEYVPALEPMPPRFLGAIAVGDLENRQAIVTEDVSMGKSHSIWPYPLPEAAEREMFEAFRWAGEPQDVFDQTVLDDAIAYGVAGRTRLLDFTPPLFREMYRDWDIFKGALAQSRQHLEDLTVVVAEGSTLAQSLADYHQ